MGEMKNEVLQMVEQEEPNKSGSVHYIESREVARMIEKEHSNLLKDNRRYIAKMGKVKIGFSELIQLSSYADSQGKERSCYLVTEKGCEFIAHKMTSEKGTAFTVAYINRFHEMKGALEDGISPELTKKIISFMEKQTEFNQRIVEKLETNRGPVTEQNSTECPHRPVYIREKSMRDEEILCYRRKRLNSLVNKVSRLNGMKRNAILHNLYKRLEDELEVSLDSYMDVYQTETGRYDFTTLEVVIAYDFLCKNAILLLSKMARDLSCDEVEQEE